MVKMTSAAQAVGLGAMLAAGAARADVIYTFTGNPVPSDQIFTPSLRVDVSDAAVASGSLNANGNLLGNVLTGDTDWTSLGYAFTGPIVTSGSIFPHTDGTYAGNASFSLVLNINPDDTLTSGGIYIDDGEGDTLTVVGNSVGIGSGAYKLTFNGNESGDTGCRPGAPPCIGSGAWTATSTDPSSSPVPEPASIAMLGAGLVCLGAVCQCGAGIRQVGAAAPTPLRVRRRGCSSGVPAPTYG